MMTSTAGRLLSLPALLLLAVMIGGADGCSGNPDLAGARQAIGVNDFDRALTNVNTVLAAEPDNVEALTLKADILRMQIGRAPDAAAKRALLGEMNDVVRQAIALDPANENVGVVRTNAWALTVNEANTLLRDETAPEGAALPLFETAVELKPDSAQGHFGVGLAQLTQGNAVEAIAPLRRATEIDPSDEFSAFYLGRALLAADQGGEAITFLTGASQRFPESTSIRADLLNAYQRTGRAAEAITLYEGALETATPADEPSLRFNYGTVLLGAGRRDEAVAQFERAVALDPNNFDAQYNLGATYQNQGAEANRRAAETDDDAENRRLIGERDVFLERSLPYFQASRTAAGSDADRTQACTALFRVYTALGRTDDAAGVAECAGLDMN